MDGGLTRAALVIRSSGAQHYGVYNCSVTNEYGNANAAITLKPLSEYTSSSLQYDVLTAGVRVSFLWTAAWGPSAGNHKKIHDVMRRRAYLGPIGGAG